MIGSSCWIITGVGADCILACTGKFEKFERVSECYHCSCLAMRLEDLKGRQWIRTVAAEECRDMYLVEWRLRLKNM